MYEVEVLVLSFINGGRKRPGDVILVPELDGRVKLIREIKDKPPVLAAKGKKAPAGDFLEGE